MADQQAGWYPDPTGNAAKLRYWDGSQWTNNFTDFPSQSSIAQPVQPPGPAQPTHAIQPPTQPMNPSYVVAETPNYNNPYAQAQVNPAYASMQPQAAQQNNVLAIVSLICAIVGLCIPIVTSIVAIILGAIALKNPVQKGMAIAGLIVGGVCLLGWIGLFVLTALIQ